jgi:hypothetical protein
MQAEPGIQGVGRKWGKRLLWPSSTLQPRAETSGQNLQRTPTPDGACPSHGLLTALAVPTPYYLGGINSLLFGFPGLPQNVLQTSSLSVALDPSPEPVWPSFPATPSALTLAHMEQERREKKHSRCWLRSSQ